jgi:hypothetical protein
MDPWHAVRVQAAQAIREARPGSGERVLVAVMNNVRDWKIACDQGWYRIPVKRAPKRIGADFLAFYFTGAFPLEQRHRVLFYAPIQAYRLVTRAELLPAEANHPRARDLYFRIEMGNMQQLERPVVSDKLRRITFISTTLYKLLHASEITELWDSERRSEELWSAFQS